MRRRFVSLDRHTACVSDYEEPDRYRDIESLARGTAIARGSGLSYVAASFGEGVLSLGMRRFDRILAFNAEERWIEVEAGITLGQLYRFCLAHGFALPVQPGYPGITVGGCIAGNVHGKNQPREGLFGEHVRGLRLFHPSRGVLDLSPEREPEIFDLTIGGLGLTGVILSARLHLVPLPSRFLALEHVGVDSLLDAFLRVPAFAASHQMAYAWIDLADPARWSGGHIVAARPAEDEPPGAAPEPRFRPLAPDARRWRPRLLTRTTLPLVNRAYRLQARGARRLPLFDVLFPATGKERYFDAYGPDGFIELQTLVPAAAAADYAREVLRLLRRRPGLVGLATVKAFRGEQRLLHYNGNGMSFSVDIINNPSGLALASELDALNCESAAVTAVLKDSRLPAETARRQYREYEIFRQRLAAFDSARHFASALSRRLGL